ncbi:MAG TPA: hypothetical protein VFF37_01245, partial [Streptomyces sp.]|nr:hypothetical protein [Streptomyces sp.]
SVRTVNNHLQHAYTKLGVTTRRELAAVLERSEPQHGPAPRLVGHRGDLLPDLRSERPGARAQFTASGSPG